jgi:ferredoxin
MRITIDPDRCNGHGRCYSLAPTLFGDDEDGRGVVIVTDVADEHLAAARTAIANCPEQAIALTARDP